MNMYCLSELDALRVLSVLSVFCSDLDKHVVEICCTNVLIIISFRFVFFY
jgi:hypothetical protein